MSKERHITNGGIFMQAHQTDLQPDATISKKSIIGPGPIVAATGVGAGDLVAALVAGTNYGLVFLWAIILGSILKFALNEGVGRWHVTSGMTMLEGWHKMGKWATGYFGVYSIIWGFVYGAAGTASCALAMSALFPQLTLTQWAIIHGIAAFLLVWSGKYKIFESAMNVLIGIMFITVVGSALIITPQLGDVIGTLFQPYQMDLYFTHLV